MSTLQRVTGNERCGDLIWQTADRTHCAFRDLSAC